MSNAHYPKNYTANDLHISHVISEKNMEWAVHAIEDINSRIKMIEKSLSDENLGEVRFDFHNLKNQLDIYKYLFQELGYNQASQVEAYKSEMDIHNQGAPK
ncbi:hypothetical protein [Acinetobacter bereziniae]|uniref:hypothetical protein n=1 Tax=Acinetobacter bereziniae TaxID=106648 RepID=UPI001117518F|nr:hypothetical protein [Acinetobacter bereziniae]QQC79470.1 hypothetical protein I9192_16045 [Acinetobacter bereziniae]TNL51222.1 hypothetical protein EYB59_08860 [Acinetobacter bereziniae]TNL58466.1 hypothetical protein EYY58_11685 [Acinetobacter bereziniae]UUN92547.1 hypothetical protein I9189_015910 [Acinetobacter bereziniae]